MLLMNEEETKTITEKTATVLVPEEKSQEEVIRELEEVNRGLTHQLADTRYKLNQTEIWFKEIKGQLKRTQATLDSHKIYYEYLIDKILDRVNRND